jgi:hypothetical protein
MMVVLASLLVAADATGKWTAVFDTPIGTLHYTYDLKADGAALTGTASWDQGSGPIEEGKISGDDISFVENADFQGQKIRIEYKGKIAGDEMQLHRTVGEFGSEDIVAKRAQ